jgi:hypothetical protein
MTTWQKEQRIGLKMPRGPRGEKRPADVIGAAVMVAKIATGEVEDAKTEKHPHAVALGKSGGTKGGRARVRPKSAAFCGRIFAVQLHKHGVVYVPYGA